MRVRNWVAAMAAAAFVGVGTAYAAAPTLSWSATFGGTALDAENAVDVTTDAAGNVYALAVANNGSIATPNYDMVVRKFSPSGSVLWTSTYDAVADEDDPVGVHVDGSGNVYVGGFSFFSATDSDSIVIKYNSAGVQQWVYREIPNGVGNTNADEFMYGFAVGPTRVYICSDYGDAGAVSYDGALIAIDTNGVRQWGVTFNGASNGYDIMNDAVVLPNGNVVARGRVRNAVQAPATGGGRRNLMACYTPAGVQVWTDQFLTVGANNEWTDNQGIAMDASGNTYVGTFTEWSGTLDYYQTVMKYTSTGTRSYTSTAADVGFDSYCNGVAVDGSGNAYAIGYKLIFNSAGSEDLRVRKINSAGTTSWDTLWNGASNLTDVAFEGFVDGDGNVTVCGFTDVVSGTDRDAVLLNFKGSDGSLNWSKQWNNGAANDYDLFGFITPSTGGSIVLAGYTYINAADADALVQKYEFAPTDIVAAGYQVNYGVETTAPGVSNLQANDANTVQLCLNPDQEDPNPVQMEVSATNGNVNPSSLNFNLVCRAEANDREVYVEMFNFNVGDWVGSPSFPVTDSDALYTVAAPGTAGQFVNDGDGAMITRITGFLGAADSPTLPCWDFNYCYWN